MRPAAFGIAYYVWLSWRQPLKVMLGAVVCFGFVGLLPVGETVRVACITLACFTAFGCCAIFSVLFEADADRIGFPRSLFTLPLHTCTLVFWPWLFGATSLSLLWVLVGTLVNWFYPTGLSVVLVPALFLTVWIAWLQ